MALAVLVYHAACAYWGAMDYRGSYYNSVHGGALFTTQNPPNSPVPDYLWEACANYPAGSAQPKTPCGGCTDRNRNNVGGRSMHVGGLNVAAKPHLSMLVQRPAEGEEIIIPVYGGPRARMTAAHRAGARHDGSRVCGATGRASSRRGSPS